LNPTSYPLITIIIAVYNGAKTLQHCIDSIVQQTYPHKELIIIDGDSTDETTSILQANSAHINYWVSEPDRGIYNAWNKGLRKSTGEWVCFVGADDFFWSPKVLENFIPHLIQQPAAIRIVYAQVMLVNADFEELFVVGQTWQDAKKRFTQIMSIPHPGTMHRSTLFSEHGQFDESFLIAGDYELLLRELKSADAVFINDLIVMGMRQGGVSSSPQNTLQQLFEVRRAQIKNGLTFPGILWILALSRVYFRLLLWQLVGEKQTRKILDKGRNFLGLPSFWSKT
jgi:glycosyltransferase involved in cell wall biosynthesis